MKVSSAVIDGIGIRERRISTFCSSMRQCPSSSLLDLSRVGKCERKQHLPHMELFYMAPVGVTVQEMLALSKAPGTMVIPCRSSK